MGKKTAKYCDKHPGLFLYFRIRFKKRLRAESKIFFQPNPNIMIFDLFSFFYPPPPFLVSNEKKQSNIIAKTNKPSRTIEVNKSRNYKQKATKFIKQKQREIKKQLFLN